MEVRIVHLTDDQLAAIVARATADGYRRAAEERERSMREIADRLDAPALKDVLTTKEAAAHAGVRPDTVLDWIKGRGGRPPLPARRSGRGYRIRRADLDDHLAGDG